MADMRSVLTADILPTSDFLRSVLRAERVLVVAPHPDDESLGCGGLIARLATRGSAFHTVFVTDGAASHRGSRTWPRQRLAARREAEAAEALDRLGVGVEPRSFLRLHDADMPARPSAAWDQARAELEIIVRSLCPDLALLPWRRDPHRDHREAWRLARDAIRLAGLAPMTLEYAIWLDELGEAVDHPRADEADAVAIDVSAVLAKKRAAVAAHLSQTSDLIDDDPDGFRLTPSTIARLTGTSETYWRPRDEAD